MSPVDRPWAIRNSAIHPHAAAGDAAAAAFHRTMPGYAETPLVSVPALADRWGVASVHVKDESHRLGLPAFKILGASWAVNRAINARLGLPPSKSFAELAGVARGVDATLVTATDGNHGRALAHMARLLGLSARIYVPGGLPQATMAAMQSEGAQVIDTGAIYDDAVATAAASVVGSHADGAESSAANAEFLIQDTAWEGYEQVPQWIIDGYGTLFGEIDRQLPRAPSLVAVPTGVGSLLQAALTHYRAPVSIGADGAVAELSVGGEPGGVGDLGAVGRTRVLAVEPTTAACVTASLAAGRPVTVDTSEPTTMAGLNCGTVSATAWPLVRGRLDAGIGVTDSESAWAVEFLAEHGLAVGACGAAAAAGVEAARSLEGAAGMLRLDRDAQVVVIATDGPAPTGHS